MKKALRLLPEPNYHVLDRLMMCLHAVALNSADNGVDAECLSDIFGYACKLLLW